MFCLYFFDKRSWTWKRIPCKKECQRNPPDRPIHADPSRSHMWRPRQPPLQPTPTFKCFRFQDVQNISESEALEGWSLLQRKLSWPSHGAATWIRIGDRPGGLRWHPSLKTCNPERCLYIVRNTGETNHRFSKTTNRINFFKPVVQNSILRIKCCQKHFSISVSILIGVWFVLKSWKTDFVEGVYTNTPFFTNIQTWNKTFFFTYRGRFYLFTSHYFAHEQVEQIVGTVLLPAKV
jgi:hypothetical protein